MSWDSIISQARIKKMLQSAIERNHLAHAYLFYGSEGVGQEAMALELAKVLNCSSQSSEACDDCPDCRKNAILQHPDTQLIFPLPLGKNEIAGDPPLAKLPPADIEIVREQVSMKAHNPYHTIIVPKATSIKLNSIREIRRSAALSRFIGRKKVYIIFQAEKMNDESSNALLKTLEEPLADTIIILTTDNADQLLPTIVSRCQRLRFDPLSDSVISEALITHHNLDAATAELLSEISMGNYALAVELKDTDITEYRNEVVDFLRTILYRSREDIYKSLEEFSTNTDRKEVERSLIMLQAWFHDAMTMQQGEGTRKHLEENSALKKFIQIHPQIDYARVHQAVSEAVSYVNKNLYIPLILTVLSFKLRTIILSR
ncbi:MAG: ATP-binding protein [Bacteroidota bacterium]